MDSRIGNEKFRTRYGNILTGLQSGIGDKEHTLYPAEQMCDEKERYP